MMSTLAPSLATPTPNPSPQGGGEYRRGTCPGLSAPMPTGDGLLVRFLSTGTIPLDAFGRLCAAARQRGNGIIEITARGSIQIRGLTTASAPRFADAIAALDIAADGGIPVISNALAGLDPEEILDAGRLAADVRRTVAETSLVGRLAPKVSVMIDGGGALALDDLAADVRLRAEAAHGGAVLRVSVGGDRAGATELGVVAPDRGVIAVMRLLDVIAHGGRANRARDLIAANGIAAFRKAMADILLAQTPPHRPRPRDEPRDEQRHEPIGTHRLRDRTIACGIGLAFGHADAAALERLVEAARALGAVGLGAAPGRALMILGLTEQTATSMAAAAENLGFIVDADDPRRHVIACAGAPICSSGHIAARAIAPRLAGIAAPYLGAGFDIHISGCAKGCAKAKAAALTVVGLTNGCALIADGSVRDIPFATVAIDELPAAIARHARSRRRPGQSGGGHV
jgi:precorrin-3B synthase